jgi:hypothetical protein
MSAAGIHSVKNMSAVGMASVRNVGTEGLNYEASVRRRIEFSEYQVNRIDTTVGPVVGERFHFVPERKLLQLTVGTSLVRKNSAVRTSSVRHSSTVAASSVRNTSTGRTI